MVKFQRNNHFMTRAQRYQVDFLLSAQTFGTGHIFQIHSINVSESGILVTVHEQDVPWIEGTLLELKFDGAKSEVPDMPQEQISLTAKVVRVEKDGAIQRFGLKLVEMDLKDKTRWARIMRTIELHVAKSSEAKVPPSDE